MDKWSETQDATEAIQRICDQVKGQVEEKTGENYVEFKAVEYRYQFVGGLAVENFLIKVHVGEDYDHLMVNQMILGNRPSPPSVLGVEQHKTKDYPLVPFNN